MDTYRPHQVKRSASVGPDRVSGNVPGHSQQSSLGQLQQGLGNRALGHILQTKLRLSEPGDSRERQADVVTRQVMRRQTPFVPESASNSSDPHTGGGGSAGGRGSDGPAILNRLGQGRPLSSREQAFFAPRFGRDFSDVRVHTNGIANATAESLQADAFTVGNHIGFRKGSYAANSAAGQELMAHELTHVVQQTGVAGKESGDRSAAATPRIGPTGIQIQRRIAAADLPRTPVERIMADDTWFENGITRISFYTAELAILHYADGTSIRLGLVPDYIQAPFEGVDYRTARAEHLPMGTGTSLGTGSIRFIPRARQIQAPPGTTISQIARAAGRTIRFRIHQPSGRIVPTEVNSVSAPRLSAALRRAEAQYVQQMNQMAQSTVRTLRVLQWVIIIYSLGQGLLAGGGRAAAARGGAGAASAIAARAQSRLVRFFMRLFRRGGSQSITVEGVQFSTVRVSMRGTQMVVQRFGIKNVSAIAGRGRLIHSAFEQAAIQAARQAGARSVRVALETVVNPRWRAYLETLGYAKELVPVAGGGFQSLWIRVFTL